MAVVPSFSGVLDGNGFCIENLSITGGGYLGLFGSIEAGGSVKNLGIKNCSVSGSFAAVGGLVGRMGQYQQLLFDRRCQQCSYIGGLVGENGGSIINCYSTGTVTGSSAFVGGLVGDNYGSISDCYSTGDVNGNSEVGGLVGYNDSGTISNCYSISTVSDDDPNSYMFRQRQ